MPTKLSVVLSFHWQVIVVFVCILASLPRACSLPGERLDGVAECLASMLS